MNTAMMLRRTPFHDRAAEANRDNAWLPRGGFTLAAHYTSIAEEALAARLRVAMADISWRWRVALEGGRAGEMLSHLVTRDATKLAPGEALKALWLTDGAGVRGAGVVVRCASDAFLLASAAPDAAWFERAAVRFGVDVREKCGAGLAVIGPYAAYVLRQAELDAILDPLRFRKVRWNGLDVTLSRWGEHGGYEIWCEGDDAPLVWDRIARAGEAFGILPAGVGAMDVLDIEAGVLRPERDYDPARSAADTAPSPQSLGLERLIDEQHTDFTGRRGLLAARQAEQTTIVGLEIESDQPASHTPLIVGGRTVGHAVASCYSPALRRAIAIARMETTASEAGTMLMLTLAPTRRHREFREVGARVARLPFLPAPDPLPA